MPGLYGTVYIFEDDVVAISKTDKGDVQISFEGRVDIPIRFKGSSFNTLKTAIDRYTRTKVPSRRK